MFGTTTHTASRKQDADGTSHTDVRTPEPGDDESRRHHFPFRSDIEGFRGLRMLLILLYHADVPGVTGGYVALDLFFVMSGFLITGLLISEIERTGRLRIGQFFARRIRRLVPALTLMLVVVAVVARRILAPVEFENLAKEVLLANLYVVNWKFVDDSIDYMVNGAFASPLQHAWSLAVEEQFYLGWPLLLTAAVLVGRSRLRCSMRGAAALTMVVLGACSLIYSVMRTATLGSSAYFMTFPRVWEFTLGGLIALIPAAWRRPGPRTATAAIVAALAAYCAVSVIYDSYTQYPGWAVVVPSLAAGLLIYVGAGNERALGHRFLSLRPFRFVGRISYSWYLWHWPAVVLAVAYWGDLSPWAKLAVVAASIVPTVISYAFVEVPLRQHRWLARRQRRTFMMAFGSAVLAGGAAVSLTYAATQPRLLPQEQVGGFPDLARVAPFQTTAQSLRPLPSAAHQDVSDLSKAGCLLQPLAFKPLERCVTGDLHGSIDVVMYGASLTEQWVPAVETIARRRGWRVTVLTKGGCPSAKVSLYYRRLQRRYTECETFRLLAMRQIARMKPDMIITSTPALFMPLSGSRPPRDVGQRLQLMEDGYVAAFRELIRHTPKLVAVGETPRPSRDPLQCASSNLHRLGRCVFTVQDGFRTRHVGIAAAQRVRGVHYVEVRSAFCRDGRCPVVIGNALIYRNQSHITKTYVMTLVSWLDRRVPKPVATT